MKIINKLAIVVLATTFVTACQGPSQNEDPKPDTKIVLPTSITIDPSSITLEIGEKYRDLNVTFVPTDANKSLTWSVLDEKVVAVNQVGDITALAPGTTKVIATSTVNEEIKAEVDVTVNRGPLTASEKINNSLGNIKFQGEAYKELYSEGKEEPGTIIKDTMISQFTENSYHFELGQNFDSLDFGGEKASLWHEDGKVVQYLHNSFTNEIERVEAKYDDGSAPSWDNFKNPMNVVKELKLDSIENEVSLNLINTATREKARELVERVAFWPLEANVMENVTLKFNESMLTNISFRTIKHSDKFQECVYGASLDVVAYGDEVKEVSKPEPLVPTAGQGKLGVALKELDDNHFVINYVDELTTNAVGDFYKTDKVIFYKDQVDDKYSRGIAEIEGEVYEIAYSFDLKKLARLNKPVTLKDGTKPTLKQLGPTFNGISPVFFKENSEDPNKFFIDDRQLCQFFGNLATSCLGPFDTGLITSELTEITLGEDGKVKSIGTTYVDMPGTKMTVKQIGGEIASPIDVTTLEAVEKF